MKRAFLLFTLVALFFGCQHAPKQGDEVFFKGKDSYERDVLIKNEPQRIVSFSQAVTEAIYLLHAEKKLVGISTFCTYPPETEKITKVGDLLNINVESVLAQRPDLIIVGSVVSPKTVDNFEKAGVPVYCLKEEDRLADMPRLIRSTGRLLNRDAAADSLAKVYEGKIRQYQSRAAIGDKSVYYVVGFGASGDFTASGNTFIHDIITLAGGRNIGEPLTTWSVSREFLFQQDPEYIFIRKEDLESFCNTAPYNLLTAVKEGRIYPIESGWIDNLCPRNFLAIDYIAEKIGTTAP